MMYFIDFGNSNVSHVCTFTTGGSCILPTTTNFSDCKVRCFGYGFFAPPRKGVAQKR